MQRRLLAVYLSLTVVLILAFHVPLGLEDARRGCEFLWSERWHDTRHRAESAPALFGAERAEVYARDRAADRRNGVAVYVADHDGSIIEASGPLPPATERQVRARLREALREAAMAPPRPTPSCPALPDHMVVAAPAVSHGRVIGAVATVSSTERLADDIRKESLMLLLAGLLSLVIAAMAVLPVVRWILHPVWQLGHAVREIANGRYTVRAPETSGPAEIRDLAAAFNTMTDRLTASLEAQRAFAADASHQLRNPLSGVRLRIECLERHVAPEGRAQLAAAVVEVARLSQVIDQLLTLARAEGQPLRVRPVDVHAVLRERAEAWREQAEPGGVRLAVRGEPLPALSAEGALDQILDVLLENALRHSPQGATITLEARAGADRDVPGGHDGAAPGGVGGAGGWVEVHVVDEGPGMSPEERARACDRFWKGPPVAGQPAGSGLGLAIARALAQASGGDLRLDAARPRGIDAVVTLRTPSEAEGASDHDQGR